jgi:hypothetical protein
VCEQERRKKDKQQQQQTRQTTTTTTTQKTLKTYLAAISQSAFVHLIRVLCAAATTGRTTHARITRVLSSLEEREQTHAP